MKTETIIKISNPHEVARLLNLIDDGIKILAIQNRTQRGIDGYTSTDLVNWKNELSQKTNAQCKFANGKI